MALNIHSPVEDSRRRKGLGRTASIYRMVFLALIWTTLVSANSVPDGGGEDTTVDAGTPDAQLAPQPYILPTVCLSPGHPSYEGDKYYEAVLNRRVAYKLKALLLGEGYDVVLSTDDLTEETLFAPGFDSEDEANWERLEVRTPEEKAEICNDADADYVISIHHNFAYNPAVNYTLVFYGAAETDDATQDDVKRWAQSTARSLGRVMKTDGSRAYSDLERLGFSLGIVANSNAPTILTEGSFYSNPKERKRLNNDTYVELEAKAVFDAFDAHYQKSSLHR